MGDALRRRLSQSRFESPQQEAMLSLLVAAAHLLERLDRVCARHRITRGQYNVLRILRGVHPQGYARCDIARRLIERAPDVTRLIGRLERDRLVERVTPERDRRLSITRITRQGLQLLERMRADMDTIGVELEQRLSPEDARSLARLCERLYESAEETASAEPHRERP